MSAVHGIVRAHGGALVVESEVGRGSTFRVLFPVSTIAPADRTVTIEHRSGMVSDGTSVDADGAVLIVDDEQFIRDLCSSAVERIGRRPLIACDGLEALEMLKQHGDDIKCVLLDLTMPNMNGVATFEAMIRIKPDVKVILCSGYNHQHAIRHFSGRSPCGFIHKPFRLATLQTELGRVLQSNPVNAEANEIAGTTAAYTPV